MPPHVFSLDAGWLRYARFGRGAQGPELEEHHAVALGEEAVGPGVLGGSLRDVAALRDRLGELLGRASTPVGEASLVLPDSWIRISFAETEDLPRSAGGREEVLRWKLRRLIPFRVEDLRLRDLEVPALSHQQEPRRVLLVFGMESVLAQLEEVFDQRGIRLGNISNESLSLLDGIGGRLANLDLGGAVFVADDSYALLFAAKGIPVIYRYKELGATLPVTALEKQILRDLRLTRKFLRDRMEGVLLRRVLLASDAAGESAWRSWLEDVFEVPVNPLSATAPFDRLQGENSAARLAPMLGAASRTA